MVLSGLDDQLGRHRALDRASRSGDLLADPVHNQLLAQVLMVHPDRHDRVVVGWDEQAHGEAADEPLDRAAPGRVLGADGEELPGELERAAGQVQLAGDPVPQPRQRGGDVRGARRRGRHLLVVLLQRPLALVSAATASPRTCWCSLSCTDSCPRAVCSDARYRAKSPPPDGASTWAAAVSASNRWRASVTSWTRLSASSTLRSAIARSEPPAACSRT